MISLTDYHIFCITEVICLYLEFWVASSDISFFLMDPYNYFGFGLPDSIEKRALYHACCKLLANVLLAIVFLTLLLLDDISKSLFLITTIIDNIF